ncbi:MAG: hypothetical protein ACI8ZM_002742 [Crocinitomix sp.]|jgi:hypothetical protein
MNIKIKLQFSLLIFVLFPTISSSYAQAITLGTGTSINGITTSSPINIWFRKTVCQMVYTGVELSAAGAVSGPITQLGFYISNNPIYDLPEYEISIKHTTDADASGDLEGGYTIVKTMANYVPSAGGWDMLELDTPFEWDGIQNIVVRVCWSRVNPTYDPSGQLRVYNSTNAYKYRRSDAPGTMCTSSPNTLLNTKPQIRFVFLSETEWTGAINTDWLNASNWTGGVPSETMDALIPSGTVNEPYLNGFGACKNLTNNGVLTLDVLGQLDIYSNFINNDTYSDLGGITNFTGVAAHEITTSTLLTIEKLRLNSSAGLEIISGEVIVGQEVQINKGIFNTGDALTLRSDASGTARIDELSTTCTYTLNMNDSWGDGWNGGFISVLEDGLEIGTYACIGPASSSEFQIVSGAEFELIYTAGSFEGENTYTLNDELGVELFADGPSPATVSVYTETAGGCEFASTINGDITMQRYIDEGETFWRYFASAVEDPTISQYLDDFTTAGFPGSPFPDFLFNSIYSYDETLAPGDGYVACTGADEVIEVGQGYQVWSGDTITGTEPFYVDLSGPPNQGDIVMPVTYTASDTPDEDGWCLVGNPYPSTIDWDSPNWTKLNMADATYIQDPDTQNYATYISGAGTNGGSRFIASQQSFWVHAISDSPELIGTEGVKSDVDATFFRAGEIFNQGMTIQLDGGPFIDEAVIRHIDGAIEEIEFQIDAPKLFGGWGVNPQISFVNNEDKDLTVHSFDKGFSEWEIPLRTIVFENGDYELKFINAFELDVPCLVLEDTYSGIMYPIEEESVLNFEMSDTTFAPRFILHVGRDYESEKSHITCFYEMDGSFELDLDIDADITYELLLDGLSEESTGSGNPLLIEGLDQGLYVLIVDELDDVCEVDTFYFTIHEPSVLEIEATLTDEVYGFDGAIELEVEGGIDPYVFDWSNGAITNSIFGLSAGSYELLITDNKGCQIDTVFSINSFVDIIEKEFSTVDVIFNKTLNQLELSGQIKAIGQYLSLYSSTGQLIKIYNLTSDFNNGVLLLPKELEHGVYFLRASELNWFYRFAY